MPSVKAFAANMIHSAMSSTAMRRGMKRAPMFGAAGDKILNSAAIRQRAAAIADDLAYAGGPIVVHGSPAKGLTSIDPKMGSAALPDKSVAYGWKTSDVQGYNDSDVLEHVTWNNLQNPRYTRPGNSIYIAQAKRGSEVVYDSPSSVFTSDQPLRVLKELSGDEIETAGRIDEFKMLDSLKSNLEKLGVTHHTRMSSSTEIIEDYGTA
jgi:hypothetical protein